MSRYVGVVYCTYLIWRNIPLESKEYKYRKCAINWMEKQRVKIINNGNCSMKNTTKKDYVKEITNGKKSK